MLALDGYTRPVLISKDKINFTLGTRRGIEASIAKQIISRRQSDREEKRP